MVENINSGLIVKRGDSSVEVINFDLLIADLRFLIGMGESVTAYNSYLLNLFESAKSLFEDYSRICIDPRIVTVVWSEHYGEMSLPYYPCSINSLNPLVVTDLLGNSISSDNYKVVGIDGYIQKVIGDFPNGCKFSYQCVGIASDTILYYITINTLLRIVEDVFTNKTNLKTAIKVHTDSIYEI